MDREDTASRGNVRVSVFFPIQWSVAADPENLAKTITSHRTCDRFSAAPTAFADLPADLTDLADFQETSPHLYSMWMSIERKLDHLLWHMNKKEYEDPEMEDGVCLDLSVGGASIQTARELSVGNFLHIRMRPPMFPVFLVEALAKVITSEGDHETKNRWVTNLEFTAINTNDSEDLISFIFKRQREILRNGSGDL